MLKDEIDVYLIVFDIIAKKYIRNDEAASCLGTMEAEELMVQPAKFM